MCLLQSKSKLNHRDIHDHFITMVVVWLLVFEYRSCDILFNWNSTQEVFANLNECFLPCKLVLINIYNSWKNFQSQTGEQEDLNFIVNKQKSKTKENAS